MRMPHARELGEILVHVPGNPAPPGSNAKLKAAALALARAPEREMRNVIAAYSWAYCELPLVDDPRATGMFLLLRVLFVVPDTIRSPAHLVHADASGHALKIDPTTWTPFVHYSALGEYDYFAAHFRRRTMPELEALQIR